jgi:Na+-transporting NADH:ubiquinone oxidoreductase subunit NqrC
MDLIDLIQHYWTVILLIGGIIMSWARYEAKNTAQDKQIADLEKRMIYTENKLESHVKNTDLFREEIKSDITEIKTNLLFIKEALSDLKKK